MAAQTLLSSPCKETVAVAISIEGFSKELNKNKQTFYPAFPFSLSLYLHQLPSFLCLLSRSQFNPSPQVGDTVCQTTPRRTKDQRLRGGFYFLLEIIISSLLKVAEESVLRR